MTEYVKFPVELLDDFCMKAFGKLGFKKSESISNPSNSLSNHLEFEGF